jgi:phosphatidylglycerol---prolipoprotein diacylglyceryl transferase
VRTTLFYIPAEFVGWPVFGFGWALAAWIVLAVGMSIWLLRRPQGRRELANYLPVFVVVAAAIAFLLPTIVEYGPDSKPLGLPVRGYGVMLMLATVAGVGLAAYRAWQVGFDPEIIYSLAFVMFIAGIVGARVFYVVEYWQTEFAPAVTGGALRTVQAIANVPKGGLVVYGSVIFGLPAGFWFCRRRKLPVLAIGDIIAPSMVVGLALGRVGCFLNGCCYGGVCLNHEYALSFPADSPPYVHQESYGWRSGIWLDSLDSQTGRVKAAYVAPLSGAALGGLKAGDEIIRINGAKVADLADARERLAAGQSAFEIETADGRVLRWTSAGRPARSVPIHPTQLYAAIDAGLLAAVLWFLFPYRRHDGEVFAVLVTLHPISRFFLEMIRVDEPKSPLTVSQWISVAILAAGVVLWIYVERQPKRTA